MTSNYTPESSEVYDIYNVSPADSNNSQDNGKSANRSPLIDVCTERSLPVKLEVP